MIRLNTNHLSFVNHIMKHPEVYPDISDDGSPEPEKFDSRILLDNENVYLLSPDENSIFIFQPMFYGVYQQHTCVLPDGRGKQAIVGCHSAWRYMYNEGAFKIMGFYPSYNRKAGVFAALVGFKREGILTSAWMKNGEIFDLIIVGTEV